ncbi:MAG: DNA polymerase III subunit beta [Gemmataceae bacterium]
MRVICHREGLLAACQLANAAIPAKDLKPILKNLKAIAGEGRCTLIATDQEVGIRLDVQGLTIQEPGEAILPAARLIAILREARDGELTIEADPNACLVRGTQAEFEMPSEDPAQFPDFPTFTDERYHEISAGSLREMIRRTVFATADETARFSMTGVLWELDGGQARLVATDGRRLALAEGTATAVGGHTTRGQTPVVPTKAMTLLERNLADDPEDTVRVCLRPNEVLFRTGRAVIYSRLVEGRYPDYRAVLPKKSAAQIELPVADFHPAVRQAAIMTDTDSKRVTFKFGKGKLTLLAQGATAGRSKVEMPLAHDGKPIDVNFNPEYLIDMLKVLPADATLTAELTDGASPGLFRCGGDYSYLVMPLT